MFVDVVLSSGVALLSLSYSNDKCLDKCITTVGTFKGETRQEISDRKCCKGSVCGSLQRVAVTKSVKQSRTFMSVKMGDSCCSNMRSAKMVTLDKKELEMAELRRE